MNIVFAIPASTALDLDAAFPGFDPVTQTWGITLASPLPAITRPISIDGYTQANVPVPFRYPIDLSSQDDFVAVDPSVTGGTYQLSIASYEDRSGTRRGGTTTNIPYNATGAYVQTQLEGLVGIGNVTVIGQSQAIAPMLTPSLSPGSATGLAIDLQANGQLLAGANPVATIDVISQGGSPVTPPVLISSIPNTTAATSGNNAQVRVVIDGSQIPESGSDIGFVLSAPTASSAAWPLPALASASRFPARQTSATSSRATSSATI